MIETMIWLRTRLSHKHQGLEKFGCHPKFLNSSSIKHLSIHLRTTLIKNYKNYGLDSYSSRYIKDQSIKDINQLKCNNHVNQDNTNAHYKIDSCKSWSHNMYLHHIPQTKIIYSHMGIRVITTKSTMASNYQENKSLKIK